MKKLIITIIIFATIGLSPLIMRLLGVIDGNLSCDFISQILPLTIEAKKMLSSGIPMWSWNSFLGDNFIGANNFYVLGTPFTLICCLFPYKYIGIEVILCLILQVVFYGVTFMTYLRRMGFNDELSRLGALMYAFSSFCIVAVYYFSFAIGIILFPLILVCIEDLLEERKYAGLKLAIIVGLSIVCNFYFAAMSLFGAALYFIIRLLYSDRKQKSRLFITAFGSVLLGVMLSSIVLIPTIMCTAGSERNVAGDVETGIMSIVIGAMIKVVYIIIPRFSEGFVELYHPFANYALYLPFVSCVFVIAYILKSGNNWLSTLICCLLIILLTPLNAIFSMGASAAYARWGYILILMFILATLYSTQNMGEEQTKIVKKITVSLFIITILLISVLRFKLGCFENQTMTSIALWEVIIFTVGIMALFLIIGSKNWRRYLFVGVVLFGTANMLIYSLLLVNRSEVCNIDNITRNVCERGVDDAFRYRSDTSQPEHNVGYVLNRPVPSQFHSVQNKAMSDFNRFYRSPQNPFISITHHRESFDALTSVKEVIVYNNDEFTFPLQKVLKKTPDYVVYENEHYMPMGFAYDSFMTEDEFIKQIGDIDYKNAENNKDVGLGLLQTLVLTDNDAKDLKNYLTKRDEIDFDASLDSVVSRRKINVALDFIGDTRGFKAKIANHNCNPMVYFFSVPNDPGFTAWIDGYKRIKIYRANLGMMAVVVPPGIHLLEFQYLTPGLMLGISFTLFGILVCISIFCHDKIHRLRG